MLKLIIILSTILTGSLSYASSCGRLYNVDVTFLASEFSVEPRVFVVKEGDRVCIRLETIDSRPKNLRMEQASFWLKAFPNKPDETLYIARKKGEYKITCTGCDTKATLIVEDAKKFEAREKRQYEKESLKKRSPTYYRY